ncbi:hypothetical protein BSLG_004836 [Batrachochytrium salamandrivorans]|nr:hypothetical protein BSLG_004836 [Batrachochytrium salamandrivorans]
MAILQNVLLGFLAGHFALQARVEHVWWSHFGADVSALKSKVPSSWRSSAESTNTLQLRRPLQFMVRRPEKRLLSILSLLTYLGAAVVEIVFARPILLSFVPKTYMKPEVQTFNLYQIALYHAVVLVLLAGTILIQVSMVEEEEDAEDKARAAAAAAKKQKRNKYQLPRPPSPSLLIV